jgi:hypothetical protein
MDLPPDDRKGKMNVSPQMTKYLESISVGFMTTQTLFRLWKEVMIGKLDKAIAQEKTLKSTSEIAI